MSSRFYSLTSAKRGTDQQRTYNRAKGLPSSEGLAIETVTLMEEWMQRLLFD